jgi:hypothetical protein
MPIFRLPKRLLSAIEERVSKLFDNVKGKFLGPRRQ